MQETRHWHEDTGLTTSGRSKEEAEDYRYFPEPDLVPVAPPAEWVAELKAALPEQPSVHRRRLQEEWGFSDLEMRDVTNAGAVALVEATVAAGSAPGAAKKWWLGEVARRANEAGVELDSAGITPEQVARVQALVDAGTLTDKMARAVIEGVTAGEGSPDEVVAARGLGVVSDDSALLDGRRPRHRSAAGRGGEDPRRQGQRRGCADRLGDERPARSGRRRQGARAAALAAVLSQPPTKGTAPSVASLFRGGHWSADLEPQDPVVSLTGAPASVGVVGDQPHRAVRRLSHRP